jgi:hypothetical protein
MEIFDSTLRDVDQAAGVYLSPEQKATYPGFINWSAKEMLGMTWGKLA